MYKKLALIIACSIYLSGCAQINQSQDPIAESFNYSKQKKMQAAAHWKVLAANEALKISQRWTDKNNALYLESPQLGAFDEAFKNILTGELLDRGLLLQNESAGASILSFKIQVLKHKGRDYTRPPLGEITSLTAGIAVAARAVANWSNPELLLIPAAVTADLFAGYTVSQSNSEVIITTQIRENINILYSSSNIYYINSKDSGHYEDNPKTIKITDQD